MQEVRLEYDEVLMTKDENNMMKIEIEECFFLN